MRCKGCGLDKAPSLFYESNKSRCKECVKTSTKVNREAKREYYLEYDRNRPNSAERNAKQSARVNSRRLVDDDFREALNKTKKQWSARNPEKRKAQNAVNTALREGLIDRPSSCTHCLRVVSVQGHHWSYIPEHRLDVVWLCAACHGAEHKRLRAIGLDPDM